MLIGLCPRSFDDQALVSEFILVPVTFLSGTLIPVERLPGFLQHVVWFFPLTPAAELLRTTLPGTDSTGGWRRCWEDGVLFYLPWAGSG